MADHLEYEHIPMKQEVRHYIIVNAVIWLIGQIQ